ncbi:MAG: TrkA family potassium uptake protein [Chloroflexi bacterium]|nr:MAG: TrkA family potassium uptake protein [Chloroflexota bacterium]
MPTVRSRPRGRLQELRNPLLLPDTGRRRGHPQAGGGVAAVYLIVIGGGTVGYYLSRDLIERGEEVTLVEKDGARAEWLESQLGSIVMRGDGDELSFLATTGIERADAVLAVTGDDEDNLVSCQLAKRKFHVPKTVARVNNPANVRIFKTLGVDVALSATEVLLDLIESELANKEPARRSAAQP